MKGGPLFCKDCPRNVCSGGGISPYYKDITDNELIIRSVENKTV